MDESTAIQTPDQILIPRLTDLAYAAWNEVKACDEGDYRARHALMDFVAEYPNVITWLERDAREGRDQRDAALNKVHTLQPALTQAEHTLQKFLKWLGVDVADEISVKRAREDLKAFNDHRRRMQKGKLRVGEEYEVGTIAHYESKLAAKREEIRKLRAAVEELKDRESSPSVGASDEDQKAHAMMMRTGIGVSKLYWI